MTEFKPSALRLHEDTELFLEALNYTAAETSFAPRLIEKDYYCSVLLEYLAAADESLVFKGGTCLSKVYADFYRLSEDLDFVISIPSDASRLIRSKRAAKAKQAVTDLPSQISSFRIVESLRGANNSTQYLAAVGYRSLLRQQEEIIRIEVGLREMLLTPVSNETAGSILLNPVSRKPMAAPVRVRCISKPEAFAEKFRAALTRREVAIRDYYDIDHAVRTQRIRTGDPEIVELVRRKLTVPGNEPVDISEKRLAALRRQLESQLKPVLRESDLREFDLERAFRAVADMALMATSKSPTCGRVKIPRATVEE